MKDKSHSPKSLKASGEVAGKDGYKNSYLKNLIKEFP